jgi:hypothetical protein
LKPHEIIEQVYFLLLPCPMHKLSPLLFIRGFHIHMHIPPAL